MLVKPQFSLGSTTLYGQFASVLRSRILSNEWEAGDAIPSIDELCREYALGRVTIARGLKILAEEGLISVQRGRNTTVVHTPSLENTRPLLQVVAPLSGDAPNFTMQVLSRTVVDRLPADHARFGKAADNYVRFEKVDSDGKTPYALSVIYVPELICRKFPKGAENKAKLIRLTQKYSPEKITTGRENFRVSAADVREANALGIAMASPVAHVQRVFLDQKGVVVFLIDSTFCGDLFYLERDVSDYLAE